MVQDNHPRQHPVIGLGHACAIILASTTWAIRGRRLFLLKMYIYMYNIIYIFIYIYILEDKFHQAGVEEMGFSVDFRRVFG
jgi:hypothetical protein